jgi:CRISPR-associated protein Cas2
MEVLVTYDVATDTAAGRRRLRRVAKVCEAHGQRVQKSVFECVVNAAELELLKHRLAGELDAREDNLRLYRLREPRGRFVEVMGRRPEFDLHDPLVV